MKKFVLKSHKNKFVEYKVEHGIKVFLTGKYSNINILDAIENEGYDRETQNIVSIEEMKETPIVTDEKYWDEYSDDELKKSHEEIIKIKKEMRKYNVDKDNKFEILAFLYQYFQFSIKYYDIFERSKFPEFDDIYLLYKNDNFYSALVDGYSSSKGICELFKIMCNYFDIACDCVKVNTPKEQYINKVYFENGEISYLSLADEIGLKDGYYTFPKRKMQKRAKCLEKENLSYEYFLIDKEHFMKHHQNTKTILKKGKDFPFYWKKMLFDKINTKEQKEKAEEIKENKRKISISLEPLKEKVKEEKVRNEIKQNEKKKISEKKKQEKEFIISERKKIKEHNKLILEEKRKVAKVNKIKKQKELVLKRKKFLKELRNKMLSLSKKMLIPYEVAKKSLEKIGLKLKELQLKQKEINRSKKEQKIKKAKEKEEKKLLLIEAKKKQKERKLENERMKKEKSEQIIKEKQRNAIEKKNQKIKAKEEQKKKALQIALEKEKVKNEEKRLKEERLAKEKEKRRQEKERLAREKEERRKEEERLAREQEKRRKEEERLAREKEERRKEEERLAKEQEIKEQSASIAIPVLLATTYEIAKSSKVDSSKKTKKTREVQKDDTRKVKETRKVTQVYEKAKSKFKNLKIYPKLVEIELMKSRSNSMPVERKVQEQNIKKLVKRK